MENSVSVIIRPEVLLPLRINPTTKQLLRMGRDVFFSRTRTPSEFWAFVVLVLLRFFNVCSSTVYIPNKLIGQGDVICIG